MAPTTNLFLYSFIVGAKRDFSCTDRKFASNIGLPFQTPEEFFLRSPKCEKFTWGEFDPRDCVVSTYDPQIKPANASLIYSESEVVVFVGFPAAGKTTFYKTVMEPEGYIHINRDILGSWQRCVNQCEQHLRQGKRVVIDNTNPDPESRNRYISCGSRNGVPVRCFHFMTTLSQSKHNNKFRELTQNSKTKVTDIAYNTFRSRFVEPSITEGFKEILQITLTPYIDKQYAYLYRQFLM